MSAPSIVENGVGKETVFQDQEEKRTHALSGVTGSSLLLRNKIGAEISIGSFALNLPSNLLPVSMRKPSKMKH